MEIFEAMKKRHSVRSYTSQKIDSNVAKELEAYIDECNIESGMNIQLCLDEPNAFNSFMAHYGSFKNVKVILELRNLTTLKRSSFSIHF